ncbi:hypothetical protein N6H14_08860 [Paenibacillus sp. CC-CFT747]|nr:hypothetical protein N6H14_08860 [Paenibacillus sp. CC-CFT747]
MIRSAGEDDAWVELIGQSGMTQTSYSLFHTTDGGKTWKTVLANSTAGGGPAPGFPLNYNDGPKNNGSKPGMLYVVNRTTGFMGGYCPACDNPNSVGKTTDGGATWVNGKDSVPGGSGALLAMADASKGWLITNDASQPSAFYTTTDGGSHWTKVSSFLRPRKRPEDWTASLHHYAGAYGFLRVAGCSARSCLNPKSLPVAAGFLSFVMGAYT